MYQYLCNMLFAMTDKLQFTPRGLHCKFSLQSVGAAVVIKLDNILYENHLNQYPYLRTAVHI